jgi:hypothetical protein
MLSHAVLVEAIEADLRELRGRLGPEVVGALDALLARRGIFVEGRSPDYFHPLGQPVAELPVWVADAARQRGRTLDDAVVAGLAVASQVGYLHVRVHDDFFDHRREGPEASMVLAAALLVRHQVLLARHVPAHPDFWRLFEERWLEYGQAMLLEARLVSRDSPYEREGYEAVLRQARPLVLSGAAVLARAGLWELLEPLERFVANITLSAQLYNDASGADEDLSDGRFTWVVRRLGGLEGAGTLRRRLLFEGGLDMLVRESTEAAEAAASAARELGMQEAVAFVERRKAAMKERVQAVYRELFQRVLGG